MTYYGDAQRLQQLERYVQVMDRELMRCTREIKGLRAEQALTRAGRAPRLPVVFRAQFAEDVLLWDLFDGALDGTFLEVGANDGVALSVSYAFEAVGWTGVLIEALPEQAERCRANRPHSRVVHGALSHPGAPREVTFSTVPEDSLLSYLKSDAAHQQFIAHNKFTQKSVTVPCMTMDEALGDLPARLDFAVIDVEGAETDVLAGFNLERYRPRVMLIEDTTPLERSPVKAAMASSPYVWLGLHAINHVFVHRDEHELLARFEMLRKQRL